MFNYFKDKPKPEQEKSVTGKNVPLEQRIRPRPAPEFNEDQMAHLSEIFHLLGDLGRMRIMLLLMRQRLAVSDIAFKVKLSVSLTSHHLRLLRTSGMVKAEKEGKKVFYTINANVSDLLKSIAVQLKSGE